MIHFVRKVSCKDYKHKFRAHVLLIHYSHLYSKGNPNQWYNTYILYYVCIHRIFWIVTWLQRISTSLYIVIFYEKRELTFYAMQPTIKIYFCFFFTSRWSLSITSIMCLRHYMLSSLFLPFKVIQYFLASEHINSLNIYKWAMVLCYKVSRPFRQLHSTYSQHVNKAKIRYVCIWHLISISKLYGSICFRFVINKYF